MAASVRQIEANRRNAAGPHQMTEAGKQSVRANALRHGLTARLHVVLPDEDQPFYQQILDSLQAEYAPANTQEEMLVNQIAQHYWRLIRARNMETGAFKFGIEDLAERHGIKALQPDDVRRGGNLATVMGAHDVVFSKLNRYEASIERSYYRAVRELERQRAARPQETAAVVEVAVEPAAPEAPKHFRSVSSYAFSGGFREPEDSEITLRPGQTHAAPDGAARQSPSST